MGVIDEKKFIIGTITTVLLLTIAIGVQQGLLFATPLPYDDEQKGLDTQITIHLSHVVAENTPKGQAASKFAELVEEKKLMVRLRYTSTQTPPCLMMKMNFKHYKMEK